MNPDTWIIHQLNSLAHRSWILDTTIAQFDAEPLLKGGIIFALFWAAWFEASENRQERRSILLFTLLTATVSLAVSRLLAILLPFRERPINSATLNFQVPYSVNRGAMLNWSSFPSDHAALFLALAVGIFLASRRVGLVALFYSIVFICIPRIYVGLHYPSDILAGGLLGAGVALLALKSSWRDRFSRPILRYEELTPAIFYMLFFWVTAHMVEMFYSIRKVGLIVLHLMRHHG